MKVFSTFAIALTLMVPWSAANANVVITVLSTNPNGAPTDSNNTQFKLGLQISDTKVDAFLGAINLQVSGAVQSTAPNIEGDAPGTLADPDNVHFQSEAFTANIADPAYNRTDDSYWASPWRLAGAGTVSAPMNFSDAQWGPLPVQVTGPTTKDLAYVTVPDGGIITVSGSILRSSVPSEAIPVSQQFLNSGGTLTPVPEPSAFLLLGLLGVGQGVRVWRRRNRGDAQQASAQLEVLPNA